MSKTTVKLVNGRALKVVGEPGEPKVHSPEAFDNWPPDLE